MLFLLSQFVHSRNIFLGIALLLLDFDSHFLILHAFQPALEVVGLPLELLNVGLLGAVLGDEVPVLPVYPFPLGKLLLQLFDLRALL